MLSPDGAGVQTGQERDSSVFGSRFLPPAVEMKPLSIPGLKLDKCLGQSPLGEFWLARDGEGREFRALCSSRTAVADEKILQRLRAIQHAALPPCRALRASSDRLALITFFYEGSLRDRFEACRAAGLPGIPRAELLGYLRSTAEALDALHGHWKVPHLGLNPRNLLVDHGRTWLADYGLVQLLWLPSGQQASMLNPRYAAPELAAGKHTPAADQYSLALIYAEMLSGYHPQSMRRSGKSGVIRRPGLGRPAEASLPAGKIDLDMVVVSDRESLTRALNADPTQRFPNCTALVAALERAIDDHARFELSNAVPRVITCAELLGEVPPPDLIVPGIGQLLSDLTVRTDFRVITGGTKNSRYFFHREGFWEYSCPIQVFPNGLKLKLDGFRQQWHALPVHQDDWLAVFQMELPEAQGRPPQGGRPIAVEVRVQVQPLKGKTVGMSEARVSIRPVWERGQHVARALEQPRPRACSTTYAPTCRAAPSNAPTNGCPFSHPVRVFPLRDGTEVGEPLDGVSRDISRSGLCLQSNAPFVTDQLYLNWHKYSRLAPFAILARVVRARKLPGGVFEVGAVFHGALL